MTGPPPPVMVLLRERTLAILPVLMILPVLVTLGIFFTSSGASKAYAAETCGSGLSVHVAGTTPAACHAPSGPAAADTTEPVVSAAESSIGHGDDHHRDGHHHHRGHHHHTAETDDSSPAVEGTVRGESPQSAPVATALSAPASTEESTARPD